MFGYSATLVSVCAFVLYVVAYVSIPTTLKSSQFRLNRPLRKLSYSPMTPNSLSRPKKTRRQWNSEKYIVNGENTIVKSDPAMTYYTPRTPSYTVLFCILPASVFSDHRPSLLDIGSVIFVSQRMLSVARLEGLLPSDPKATLIAYVKRLDPPTDPAGA